MDAPLPRVDMLLLAADLPIVIDARGRIFQTISVPRPGCWLEIDGFRYGLAATETLRSVEERYFAVNRWALEAFKEQELRLVVPDLPPAEADSQKRWQVLRFVRESVIPRLAELDLAAPPPRPSPALGGAQPQPPADATSGCPPLRPAFLSLLAGRLVFFERVFGLVAADDAPGDLVVTLRQRRYVPARESIGLPEAQRRVMRRLRNLLKAQALRELPRRVREARQREREAWARLDAVGEGCVYENESGGVLVKDRRLIVFLSVPPFAVQDLDNSIYAFAATRVSLPLESVDPRETLRSGRVTVDPSFRHPFVSDSGNVCMVADATYYAELQQGDLCSGVLQLLHDAKATLSAGFTVNGTPYRALGGFVGNRVDRLRVERECLPLFRVGIS